MPEYPSPSKIKYLATALLIIVITAGCIDYGGAENATTDDLMPGNEELDAAINVTPPAEEVFTPENILRIGERFRYNDVTGMHDPSGAGDTISIWLDGSTVSKGYYLKPRFLGADLTYCPAREGEKYLFVRLKSVALKNSAYTPYINSFTMIGDDGERYSPSLCFCNNALCLSGGESGLYSDIEVANLYTIQDIGGIYTSSLIDRSEIQSVILFTVPDAIGKSTSYILLDTGGAEATWSLSDVYVDITLKKGPGTISVMVDNARNIHLARDITATFAYPDGTTSDINAPIPGIGGTAVIEDYEPGFETVTITANLYTGEKCVIYTEK